MQIFSSPSFLFSLILASLFGGLFHLIWGKTWGDFFLYWISALAGFALGQAIAEAVTLNILMLGEIHVIEASAVCWAALFIARWLKV